MNTNKEVRFGTEQQRMILLKESTRKAVAKSSESMYGIKAGETIDETAEDWAQWCEVRGNQMLADFLRKQITKSQPEQPLAFEPEIVTYEHCNDLKIPRTRFQQYAKDVLPVWAINVRPKFKSMATTEQPATQQLVAWMTEDGRVASDKTKQGSMSSPSKAAFSIPLYTLIIKKS